MAHATLVGQGECLCNIQAALMEMLEMGDTYSTLNNSRQAGTATENRPKNKTF